VTEGELAAQYIVILDRISQTSEYWTSVSFSILVLAYLAASKLNKMLVIAVVAMYSVFTLWTFQAMMRNGSWLRDIGLDLKQLNDSGVTLGNRSSALMETILSPSIAYQLLPTLVYIGTYFASIGYLIYAFRNRDTN